VKGLDAILGGGLLRDRVYLFPGAPGVGKTTLGLQFLLEGARLGEKGLYITFSETKEEIEGVADSHGWDLSPVALFRYFEAQGAVRQAISVIKKRSGHHERTIREFAVGAGGVRVGKPLVEMDGVLTGLPIFRGEGRMDRKPAD